MEKTLTLEELNLIAQADREKRHEEQKFFAALKGIDLDETDDTSEFEEVRFAVEAELAGKSRQEHFFDTVGIEVEFEE